MTDNKTNIYITTKDREKAFYEMIKKESIIKYNKTEYFSFFIDKHIHYEIDEKFDFKEMNEKNLEIFEHNMKLTLLKNISDIILKYALFSYLKGKQHSIIFFIKMLVSIGLIFVPVISPFGIVYLSVGGMTIMNILFNSVSAGALLTLSGTTIYSYKKIDSFIKSSNDRILLLNHFLFDKREDGGLGEVSRSYEDSFFKKCRKYLITLLKKNIFIYHDPTIQDCDYFVAKIYLDSFQRDNNDIYFHVKACPIKLDMNKITYHSMYNKYVKGKVPVTNNNNKYHFFRTFANHIPLFKNQKDSHYLSFQNIFNQDMKLSNKNREIWNREFKKRNNMEEKENIEKNIQINSKTSNNINQLNQDIKSINDKTLDDIFLIDESNLDTVIFTKQEIKKRTVYNKIFKKGVY
jgi:hypothetical protein